MAEDVAASGHNRGGSAVLSSSHALGDIFAQFSPCFLGLAAVRVWLQCSIYDRYASTDSGIITVTANILRVVIMLAMLAATVHWGFSRRAKNTLAVVSVGAMTLASVLFLGHTETGLNGLLWAACLLAGFGIIWGGGMWIEFFERLPIRQACFYAFACLALSCVAGFLIGLAPQATAHLVAMFMPAVSLVAFRSAMLVLDRSEPGGMREGPAEQTPGTGALPYDAESRSTFVRLLGGIALFNLAMGFARGFPFGESISLSVPFQALHQFGTCALCLLLIWWALVRRGGLRFSVLWAALVAFLGIGVLLLAGQDSLLMETGSTLVTIANTFALGVMWFSSYDIARNSSVPGYVALGCVWAAHLLPREVGRVAILLAGPHNTAPMLWAVVMVVALAVSMTLLINDSIPRTRPFFSELRRNADAGSLRASVPPAAYAPTGPMAPSGHAPASPAPASQPDDRALSDAIDLEAALGEAGRLYQLTQRELDIARLLAQGRSKSVIGDKLCLSESTVRTHARHLYAKLDVHSRQQLIDLLEELGQPPRA